MRSIYASNTISGLGSYEVEPDMNYFGESGSLAIALEGIQNDQLIFESVIAGDFAEISASIQEGAEVEIVTEASFGDFIDKIKEYANKAWKKIKGLIMSFITKLKTVFVRDNKELVKKYRNKIGNKISDYKKFKYKWAKPKDSNDPVDSNALVPVNKLIDDTFRDILKLNTQKEIDDYDEELSDGDIEDKIYTDVIGSSSDSKSFKKDFHEMLYEDEEAKEGLDSSRFNEICAVLEGSKKLISGMEKMATQVDKTFKNTLAVIESARTKIGKGDLTKDDKTVNTEYEYIGARDENNEKRGSRFAVTSKGSSSAKQLGYNKLNLLHKTISIEQKIMNNVVSCGIAESKFYIAQCRRVFVQAASWSKVHEDVDLLQLIGEAAEFEVETSFEDYEF